MGQTKTGGKPEVFQRVDAAFVWFKQLEKGSNETDAKSVHRKGRVAV
jgi:hypothetical protein